jgi:hypothetical protein
MKSKKEDIVRREKSGMTDDLQGFAWMAHVDSRALDRLVGLEGEEMEGEYLHMDMKDGNGVNGQTVSDRIGNGLI